MRLKLEAWTAFLKPGNFTLKLLLLGILSVRYYSNGNLDGQIICSQNEDVFVSCFLQVFGFAVKRSTKLQGCRPRVVREQKEQFYKTTGA